MIENCDIHVFITLTEDTKRIFNKDIFENEEGVCFINAGRGEHVVKKI